MVQKLLSIEGNVANNETLVLVLHLQIPQIPHDFIKSCSCESSTTKSLFEKHGLQSLSSTCRNFKKVCQHSSLSGIR